MLTPGACVAPHSSCAPWFQNTSCFTCFSAGFYAYRSLLSCLHAIAAQITGLLLQALHALRAIFYAVIECSYVCLTNPYWLANVADIIFNIFYFIIFFITPFMVVPDVFSVTIDIVWNMIEAIFAGSLAYVAEDIGIFLINFLVLCMTSIGTALYAISYWGAHLMALSSQALRVVCGAGVNISFAFAMFCYAACQYREYQLSCRYGHTESRDRYLLSCKLWIYAGVSMSILTAAEILQDLQLFCVSLYSLTPYALVITLSAIMILLCVFVVASAYEFYAFEKSIKEEGDCFSAHAHRIMAMVHASTSLALFLGMIALLTFPPAGLPATVAVVMSVIFILPSFFANRISDEAKTMAFVYRPLPQDERPTCR